MLNEETKRDSLDDDSDDDIGAMKASKRKRAIESDSEDESDTEEESDGSDENDDSDDEDGDGDEEAKGHSDAAESEDESDAGEEEEEGEESEVTDSEEYDSDDETKPTTTRRSRRGNVIESESESDDSSSVESSGDPCPICLGRMKGEIGSPETCDHTFCLECILEWSKTNNSCPQDRIPFLVVFVRREVGGAIIRRVGVAESKPDDIPDAEEEDPTFCEICGRCDHEDRLLLCDGCDLGYHLECLDPPLENVPINEWFCPDCQAVNNTATAAQVVDIEDGELHDLIDDATPSSSLPTVYSTRSSHQPAEQPLRVRLLPRTRASEMVRARITRSRRQRARPSITQEQAQEYEAIIDAVAVASGSDPRAWPMPSRQGLVSKPRRSTKAPKRKKKKNN